MSLKLTQTVQKGGCAAKVAATELRKILSQVTFPPPPKELRIGAETFDDAAVFEIHRYPSDQYSLVQTLDFFTPIVDTPYRFGQIATANALSDVYAMGGRPITAMGILAFPLAAMDTQVAVEVLQGASDKLKEAKVPLVGGHSIDDETLKFGLSVTGMVKSSQTWSNAGAQVGDTLILTKPIGTGALTAALKRQELSESEIEPALESMARLNDLGELLEEIGSHVHAATDITGFGLAGHGLNVARASQCTLEIDVTKIPLLPRAMECLERGFLTKAHRTNREYTEKHTRFDSLKELWVQLVCDPQTSGGLLLSVPSNRADALLKGLQIRFPFAQKIGQVIPFEEAFLKWTHS